MSRIVEIVDYSAALAGTIEGVKAVFASGASGIADPLRPGQKIAAARENNAAAFTHWSEIPSAPDVKWVSQDGTVELTWNVPMRLWFPRSEEETRRLALPFYDRYLRAFVRDPFFGERPNGNLLTTSHIGMFRVGGDANWSWLDVGLMAVERVKYE